MKKKQQQSWAMKDYAEFAENWILYYEYVG